jgi:hypothetical protein
MLFSHIPYIYFILNTFSFYEICFGFCSTEIDNDISAKYFGNLFLITKIFLIITQYFVYRVFDLDYLFI